MSRFKIVNLFDRILITTSVFLLIYAWINFFIRDLWTSFILSIIFTLACVFLLFYLVDNKNKKKSMNKLYLKDIEEKFLAFQLLSKNEKISLLKNILEYNYTCSKIKDSLLFVKDNKKCQIMIETNTEKLSQFDVLKLISLREKSVERLIIVCHEFEPLINKNFLSNLEIEFVNKKQLYDEYFLPQKSFPDCSNLNTKTERKKFKEIAKNFFIPSKAKSYFLCGLILIFSSIILPFHIYYLIFGSTLLIFSIVCKLQPFFKR